MDRSGRPDRRWPSQICIAVALTALASVAARAQMPHHHQEAGPATPPNYVPAAAATPYDLGIKITRADGTTVDLSALKGRPTIMTMFFATCPDVCPLMTENILRVESQIPAAERDALQVVLVSFDDRDRPPVLRQYRQTHGITSPRWTVAAASPEASRALGDLLGVRYQKLPNGSYSHTAMIDLIAADGAVLARVPAPALGDPQFRAAVRAMLSMPATAKPTGKKS